MSDNPKSTFARRIRDDVFAGPSQRVFPGGAAFACIPASFQPFGIGDSDERANCDDG